jgi:hypothetical protein
VAGLRSLLRQALHPLAMAGVDQHSSWRRDPVGRLAVTMAYHLPAFNFGDLAAAMRASAWVRRIQDHVRGTYAVTGCPYAGGDPALLLWVRSAGRFGPNRRNPGRDRGRMAGQRIPALGRSVVMTCALPSNRTCERQCDARRTRRCGLAEPASSPMRVSR